MTGAMEVTELTLLDEAGRPVPCTFCQKKYNEQLKHIPFATKNCSNKKSDAMVKRQRASKDYSPDNAVRGCPMCCNCENCRKRFGKGIKNGVTAEPQYVEVPSEGPVEEVLNIDDCGDGHYQYFSISQMNIAFLVKKTTSKGMLQPMLPRFSMVPAATTITR